MLPRQLGMSTFGAIGLQQCCSDLALVFFSASEASLLANSMVLLSLNYVRAKE